MRHILVCACALALAACNPDPGVAPSTSGPAVECSEVIVRGLVVGPGGAPVSGALVVGPPSFQMGGFFGGWATQTDAMGRFDLVVPGRHIISSVVVTATGFVRADVSLARRRGAGRGGFSAIEHAPGVVVLRRIELVGAEGEPHERAISPNVR